MDNRPSVPGHGQAVGSLVLGIIAVVLACFFAIPVVNWILAIVGLIMSIIGLVLASSARKQGFEGGVRTGGFVLSLLGLIFCAISFVIGLACIGCVSSI